MASKDNGRNLTPNSGTHADKFRGLPAGSGQFPKQDQTKLRDISKEELGYILDAHKKWVLSAGNEGKKANLRGANLKGVYLGAANLEQACLEGANLQEAFFEGANLQDAYLEGANLQGAHLGAVNLQKANLREANLKNANLILANLQYANLESAELQNTDLRFSSLQNADLGGTILSFSDLRGTDLRGIKNITSVQLSNVKTLYKAKLDEDIKRQIHRNYPRLREKPTTPKISTPALHKDDKAPMSNFQVERDLRKHLRRPYSKPVFLSFKKRLYKGKIKNISSYGAFIESKNEFFKGQIFKLTIPGTKIDKGAMLKAEVVRLDLTGIGVKFISLLKRSDTFEDRGTRPSETDGKKESLAGYFPEKRSGGDRRKNGRLNQLTDNGGRRSNIERRGLAYLLNWPEKRSGKDRRIRKDRRSGIDRRSASNIKGIETPPGNKR